MDSATRYGSCVPVTTIGIAPIFAPETNGRRIRRPIANAVGNVCGAPLKTDVGRRSRAGLVQAFRMLLGHFAGKMDGDLESSRFGVGTAATAFSDPSIGGQSSPSCC